MFPFFFSNHIFEYFCEIDPCEWNSANIKIWLDWSAKKFMLKPKPIYSRFPTTGVELSEMSRAEFWVCAGSKTGGNKLAKHIAHSIYSATGRNLTSLLDNDDPGKISI